MVSPFLDRQHGTELCIIEQVERLAREGWKIELYAQKISDLDSVRLASTVPPDEPGAIRWHPVADIPGPHLFKYLWWFFANSWQRRRDRRAESSRPDLVYSPGINCLDADVIVVHIVFHEFYKCVRSELMLRRLPLSFWPRLVHRKLYYRLAMLLERKVYSDKRIQLVAVSALVAAQLEANFGRTDVAVIPNAVDILRFTREARVAKRNSSRHFFSYEESHFVLLLIGNDWKKKGLDALLKAVALLKDLPVQLLAVGNDEPDIYRTLLRELGLQDRVRFERSTADVLCFYAAADLYVGPSLEDSFGLPILEAMACGLPVIASTNAGASEMICDGSTGFLLRNPQDHLKLASLIRRIQAEDAMRLSVGNAASRHIREHCSWDQNTEKTKQLLEDIAGRLRR